MATYTKPYAIDYTATGDNVGHDSVVDGGVKKLEANIDYIITSLNTIDGQVSAMNNTAEDQSFFFNRLGG